MSFLPTGDKLPIALGSDEGKLLDVLGDIVTIKLTGEDTHGAYTVVQTFSPPQGGPPLHVHHREDEAFYVLEGELEIQCGENKIRAVPGSFVFAPREIPHSFQNINSVPAKVLILATPAGIEKFFEELSQLAKQGPPDIEKVKEIAQRYEIEFILHSQNPD
jgi:quercetin dioxygenase-like cupin family protein